MSEHVTYGDAAAGLQLIRQKQDAVAKAKRALSGIAWQENTVIKAMIKLDKAYDQLEEQADRIQRNIKAAKNNN